MKNFLVAVLSVFLLSGCVSETQFIASSAKDKKPKIYRIDLDNDGLQEAIKIEDLGTQWAITVTRKNKTEVARLKSDGHLFRVEFIDLKQDGYQQIAVFYYSPQNSSNIIIYGLKNEKISKIFEASSECGIDADLGSGLARVKVARPKPGYYECLRDDLTVWEVWVWSGDKFIKER